MTAQTIALTAYVSKAEQGVVVRAAELIGTALSVNTKLGQTCACTFVSSLDALMSAARPCLKITSLLFDVERTEPWPVIEQDLRARFLALTASGDIVFIATVFRETGLHDDPLARRIRIRRLNWLAADISRETGAFIIDLDRVLADVGAASLETDYRLLGTPVVEVAACAVASVLVSNGLDGVVEFEDQDLMSAYLSTLQHRASDLAELRPQNLIPIGQGRRRQMVATLAGADRQGHINWMIAQVFNGNIGLRSALQKIGQAVRRHGARDIFARFAEGLFKTRKERA